MTHRFINQSYLDDSLAELESVKSVDYIDDDISSLFGTVISDSDINESQIVCYTIIFVNK